MPRHDPTTPQNKNFCLHCFIKEEVILRVESKEMDLTEAVIDLARALGEVCALYSGKFIVMGIAAGIMIKSQNEMRDYIASSGAKGRD